LDRIVNENVKIMNERLSMEKRTIDEDHGACSLTNNASECEYTIADTTNRSLIDDERGASRFDRS
jgi:hypothetical protein